MRVLTTPADAFANLRDYSFGDHAVDVGGLNMHYVCEGPADGPVVVLMHGQPSWSYLYRQAIVELASAGCRVYAPDLIGFGRSDKPVDISDYSYTRHVEWTHDFLRKLDLSDISFVLHDWGGSIGLRVVGRDPDRFSRILACNTAMVDGTIPMPEAWQTFRDTVASTEQLRVSSLVAGMCHRPIDDAVAAAYDAPFPTEAHKAGVRAFPTLVPVSADDPNGPEVRAAWEVLRAFEKPFLTVFGKEDRIYSGAEALFVPAVPGTKGQPHVLVEEAGHFLQEDQPDAFSRALLGFLGFSGDRSP